MVAMPGYTLQGAAGRQHDDLDSPEGWPLKHLQPEGQPQDIAALYGPHTCGDLRRLTPLRH